MTRGAEKRRKERGDRRMYIEEGSGKAVVEWADRGGGEEGKGEREARQFESSGSNYVCK